jgi:hypothetical protein
LNLLLAIRGREWPELPPKRQRARLEGGRYYPSGDILRYNLVIGPDPNPGGRAMKHVTAILALSLLCATACVAQQSPAAPPTAAASTSAADQPATPADIDRYYDAMHVRDLMKDTMAALSKQMRQMMHDQMDKTANLPPAAREKLDQSMDKMLADMPINDILDAMRPVYAKHFTKGDIDALVAFYSTPVGKKTLAEMPAITGEAMQASSGVMQKYMEHVQEQTEQDLAEIMKDAQPDPKKATETN